MSEKYRGYYIDEETEDRTGKKMFTVWDTDGIIYLATFYTMERAKKYIDNRRK